MPALVWQQCYVLVWQQWYIIVWQQWACYEHLVLCARALGAGYVSVGQERAVASKPCLSDKKVNTVRCTCNKLPCKQMHVRGCVYVCTCKLAFPILFETFFAMVTIGVSFKTPNWERNVLIHSSHLPCKSIHWHLQCILICGCVCLQGALHGTCLYFSWTHNCTSTTVCTPRIYSYQFGS